MTNNDILRRLRFAFDIKDSKMMEIFTLGGLEVTRAEVSDFLKKDEDPDFKNCSDKNMAHFLNGFIVKNRGARDGEPMVAEKKINNNMILKKLKIALNLKSEDVLAILKLADFRLSNNELSAFFRKPDHKHFRPCMDQVLRNFLEGLKIRHRESDI